MFDRSNVLVSLATISCILAGIGSAGTADEWQVENTGEQWLDQVLALPGQEPSGRARASLEILRNDFEPLQRNRSCICTPLKIGDREFSHGLGAHANSHLRVTSQLPMQRLRAWIGVDNNQRTMGGAGSVVFQVRDKSSSLFSSPRLTALEDAVRVDLSLNGCREINLHVDNAGDGPACDHADWAEAEIELQNGRTIRLDQLPIEVKSVPKPFPFSFQLDGRTSAELLPNWHVTRREIEESADCTRIVTTWRSPSQLVVIWDAIRYRDFPAVAWRLTFRNDGSKDTEIIQNIQVADLYTDPANPDNGDARVHCIRGGVPNPSHFYPEVLPIRAKQAPVKLGSGSGRSSRRHTPFFKIEHATSSLVVGIEWSGTWQAKISRKQKNGQVELQIGMRQTHLRLHPQEQVGSPQVLMLNWRGHTNDSNAQFRQLIYRHYCPTRNGQHPLPLAFCNTCFTRGGGWLNETTAENQISLIKAYASLGLEALLTDAGWFEGGWPAGAGNWTPRKDNYPDGIRPVAQAAKDHDMIYGLWFEPERVMRGTQFHREHPDWCLSLSDDSNPTLLANFGLPEVQEHFYQIVAGFMELPGFRIYRQDFNMDPLPYWQENDAPDRQGITEIRYVEGLYAYWERLRSSWPDVVMEECASGGNRIDLGTIQRMDLHQKTDYWFDSDTDQTSLWGISQFLPNNTIVAHLRELDDYAFHSTLASSLCLGWIADAPDFDTTRAKALLDRYREVRHLLVGAWYPLLPCPRDLALPGTQQQDEPWLWKTDHRLVRHEWCGSQFHREDLDEGMLLVFRRPASPYKTVTIRLDGLLPDATYKISSDRTGKTRNLSGAALMREVEITLEEPGTSDLLHYHRVESPTSR
jgi:alpha-galactosidase